MSAHVQHAIDDLKTKRAAIDDLIVRLEWFQREFPHTAASITSDRPLAQSETNKQTNKQSKGPAKPAGRRSLPDDAVGTQENGRRQKVLAALQDGPLTTRELAAVLKIDRTLVKMTLQRMKKVDLVKSIGVRAGSKWTLPGKSSAKGRDCEPSASRPAPARSPAAVEAVEARDRAILEAVKTRPWTTAGLLTVLPREHGQTPEQRTAARDSALIRLRVKQLIKETTEGWVRA